MLVAFTEPGTSRPDAAGVEGVGVDVEGDAGSTLTEGRGCVVARAVSAEDVPAVVGALDAPPATSVSAAPSRCTAAIAGITRSNARTAIQPMVPRGRVIQAS